MPRTKTISTERFRALNGMACIREHIREHADEMLELRPLYILDCLRSVEEYVFGLEKKKQ